MTLELRRIGGDDAALLRDTRLRALADAPDAFGTLLAEAEARDDAFWQRQAAGEWPTLVAVEDGTGLAMGGAGGPAGPPTLWVWGMWTDPAARGRGLGGQVLDALVVFARGLASYDEVRLHVTEGNADARRLYTSRGFEPTGTWEPLRDGSPLRIEELRLAL